MILAIKGLTTDGPICSDNIAPGNPFFCQTIWHLVDVLRGTLNGLPGLAASLSVPTGRYVMTDKADGRKDVQGSSYIYTRTYLDILNSQFLETAVNAVFISRQLVHKNDDSLQQVASWVAGVRVVGDGGDGEEEEAEAAKMNKMEICLALYSTIKAGLTGKMFPPILIIAKQRSFSEKNEHLFLTASQQTGIKNIMSLFLPAHRALLLTLRRILLSPEMTSKWREMLSKSGRAREINLKISTPTLSTRHKKIFIPKSIPPLEVHVRGDRATSLSELSLPLDILAPSYRSSCLCRVPSPG